MLSRAVTFVVGALLIVDGLTGWAVDVVAVVAGLVLIGAVSVDQLAALRRPD